MEFLRLKIITLICVLLAGCSDDTITQVIKLRTDTYISSNANTESYAELDYLSISKSGSDENRILVKLPTTEQDEESLFGDCFDVFETCGIFLLPISIITTLLTDCAEHITQPSNLTSAVLIFNTNDGSSINSGELEIELLSKPWWHSATWNEAHPFSSAGLWTSPGGDIDSSQSFDTNCTNLSSGSCAAGEIKFEMTTFFRNLISNPNSTHYGFVIRANTDISESRIYSVQAESASSPRIVATYTGTCTTSLRERGLFRNSYTKTFYLGQPLE